ncbi:ABC transporter permease [Methylocella silvestris]|uniref:Peptide ABC transporter permease n=1 Tax=Methylocella silvestris TaxID=199596 RepID=A0A2J7TK01_METSI|nr:ABC transporter permease subunit [Methylocella silvestris]PNG27057.1 peptide ABC transporter permease [Methylocella silvestris]
MSRFILLSPARAALWRRIPASAMLLVLIALACIFGPLFTSHPFDRVYPDYVLAPPSLEPSPNASEARDAVEELAARLGAKIVSMDSTGDSVAAKFSSDRTIDAAALAALPRSDRIGPPRINSSGDGGQNVGLNIPLLRTVFPFGADANGRDLLTRTLIAGRVSLAVGLLASLVALVIGVLYGAIAGYAGGAVDALMMRIVEIIYALPFIFFVIVLVMVFGRHFVLIFIAIGAVEWLDMARIARGQTLALKEKDYVAAARALGASPAAIIRRHILPNASGPIIAYLTLLLPRVILLESFISFLGLGVQEPLASWGVLIADGARNIQGALHLLFFPALFLGATLGALQSFGQYLQAIFADAHVGLESEPR